MEAKNSLYLAIAILVVALCVVSGFVLIMDNISSMHRDMIILHQNDNELADIRQQEIFDMLK